MASTLAAAGDAMETLKMKIFMLKKENTDVTEKMDVAEKVNQCTNYSVQINKGQSQNIRKWQLI